MFALVGYHYFWGRESWGVKQIWVCCDAGEEFGFSLGEEGIGDDATSDGNTTVVVFDGIGFMETLEARVDGCKSGGIGVDSLEPCFEVDVAG